MTESWGFTLKMPFQNSPAQTILRPSKSKPFRFSA
jgi:hypothetical protein